MREMPEELYERLAAAFERTLFTSDLMQDAITGINNEGYEISLGLWAKAMKPAWDERQSDCHCQLELFDGERRPMPGEPEFELRLTERDISFLRSVGVAETSVRSGVTRRNFALRI